MFISYAQNFEDVILNRIFRDKKNGFYIDVGANHPIYDSVTMTFYERGWRGINIEPMPSQFELFVKDRPRDINLNFAISDQEKELDFFDLKGTGFSTLDKEIAMSLIEEKKLELDVYKVETRSLLSVCLEFVNIQIDFLKIDVEGWEEYVINSNDWQRFRPTVVIVEATFPGKPEYKQTNIPKILESHHYRKVYFDGLNDFYLAEESNELIEHFGIPPNVFDDFQLFKYWDMKKHADNLVQVVSDRDIEIENYIAENLKLRQNNTILDNLLLDEKFETNRLIKEIKNINLKSKQDLLETNLLVEKITSELSSSRTQLSSELLSSKNEVNNLLEQIAAIKTSKFWKLRTLWFKIKRLVGLPCD